MKNQRAPRSKKRVSCEITAGGARYAGIVLDLSATGMWVQTNAKISQKTLAQSNAMVEVRLSVPGSKQTVAVEARVARMKIVPPQFLGLQHGGVGLELVAPGDAYLAFVASISPEQAAAVEAHRSRPAAAPARGAGSAARRAGPAAPKRFRVHAVETASGRKSTYIVTAKREDDASAEVLAQLGDAYQVLFVERV